MAPLRMRVTNDRCPGHTHRTPQPTGTVREGQKGEATEHIGNSRPALTRRASGTKNRAFRLLVAPLLPLSVDLQRNLYQKRPIFA